MNQKRILLISVIGLLFLTLLLSACGTTPFDWQKALALTAAYSNYPTDTPVASGVLTPTASTKTIDPSGATETPIPTITATFALFRPSITVGPDATPSAEEEANSGLHDYAYTATYSGTCQGSSGGIMKNLLISFNGNQVTFVNTDNTSVYDKVGENTYQAISGSDVVIVTFTPDGFTGESVCVKWIYHRQ